MKKLVLYTGLAIALLIGVNTGANAQHKKISSQGQGAIIGGVGGAVVGGVVGHGAKGALIGGAIGAGGGYVIGNEHRRHVEKERRLARQRAYRRRHHHHHTYAKN